MQQRVSTYNYNMLYHHFYYLVMHIIIIHNVVYYYRLYFVGFDSVCFGAFITIYYAMYNEII